MIDHPLISVSINFGTCLATLFVAYTEQSLWASGFCGYFLCSSLFLLAEWYDKAHPITTNKETKDVG